MLFWTPNNQIGPIFCQQFISISLTQIISPFWSKLIHYTLFLNINKHDILYNQIISCSLMLHDTLRRKQHMSHIKATNDKNDKTTKRTVYVHNTAKHYNDQPGT